MLDDRSLIDCQKRKLYDQLLKSINPTGSKKLVVLSGGDKTPKEKWNQAIEQYEKEHGKNRERIYVLITRFYGDDLKDEMGNDLQDKMPEIIEY